MSEYPPPEDQEQIFNPANWPAYFNDDSITKAYADSHYLKWPMSQVGNETLQGSLTVNNELKVLSRTPYPTTLYVSKSGTPSATGSQSNPFITIQAAITYGEALYSEFTVYVDVGIYTENLTITKGCCIIGMPDIDTEQFDFLHINSYVNIIGSITNSNPTTDQVLFQNLYITPVSNGKILYTGNGSGKWAFQNCYILSTFVDNQPLYQSTTGGIHMFTSCRVIKQVNNTSAMIDLSAVQSQLWSYDSELSGNSSICMIAINGNVYLRNCSLNYGAVVANSAIIIHSGSSGVITTFLLNGFQTSTNPALIYKNTRTVNASLVFTQNRVNTNPNYTAGVNYLFESTTNILTLILGNNSYFSGSSGTLLNAPDQFLSSNITPITSKQLGNIDMANCSISNVTTLSGFNGNLSINSNTIITGNLTINPIDSSNTNATYYPLLASSISGSTQLFTDAQITVNPSRNGMTVQNLGVGISNDSKIGVIQYCDNSFSGNGNIQQPITIGNSDIPFGSFTPRFTETSFIRSITPSTIANLLILNTDTNPSNLAQSFIADLTFNIQAFTTTNTACRIYKGSFAGCRRAVNAAFSVLPNPFINDQFVGTVVATNSGVLSISNSILWNMSSNSTATSIQVNIPLTGTDAANASNILVSGTMRLTQMSSNLSVPYITGITFPNP